MHPFFVHLILSNDVTVLNDFRSFHFIPEKFLPKIITFVPKHFCHSEDNSTNPMRMISMNCLYKPLFRGFIKWQKGSNNSEMHDIDFEDSEGVYVQGPEGSLIITDVGEISEDNLFQCIGSGFDNSSDRPVLAKYQVNVVEIGKLFLWKIILI